MYKLLKIGKKNVQLDVDGEATWFPATAAVINNATARLEAGATVTIETKEGEGDEPLITFMKGEGGVKSTTRTKSSGRTYTKGGKSETPTEGQPFYGALQVKGEWVRLPDHPTVRTAIEKSVALQQACSMVSVNNKEITENYVLAEEVAELYPLLLGILRGEGVATSSAKTTTVVEDDEEFEDEG